MERERNAHCAKDRKKREIDRVFKTRKKTGVER